MKNTKILFRFAAILMTVVLLLSFAACNPGEVLEEKAEVRDMTARMLDSILNDDYGTARGLMPDSIDDESFQKFYDSARKLFDGVETYTLTMIGVKYSVADGVNRYTAVYRLATNVGTDYDVTVGTSSDMEGLYGFHLTHAGADEAIYTGTLTTLKQATPEQWVMLFVGFATLVFVIAMLVDCCRHKIKQKWLWILVIILGSVALLVTLQEGSVNLNFSFFNLLSYTALLIYQSPANVVQLRLFLPVGAIVYLVFRRRLLAEARLQATVKADVAPERSPESVEIRMDGENAEIEKNAENIEAEKNDKEENI